MPIQGHDVAQVSVDVRYLDYTKWPIAGWNTEPPRGELLAFLARGIKIQKRPFILIDCCGVMHEVEAVVNARMDTIRKGDKRLFVVYTFKENGKEQASWGEFLFLDAGERLPLIGRYDLWSLWMKTRERLWPRRDKK
jgi:hypothetical protein